MQGKQALNFAALKLSGQRVRLEPLERAYADEIFTTFTADITRYMYPAPPESIEQVYAFVDHSVEAMRRQEDLALVILSNDTGQFLGVCGINGAGADATPGIGLWLRKEAHGQGYGTEAVSLLLNWARQSLTYDYLIYPVDRDNLPSRKIAEGLGGEVFRRREITNLSGIVLNEVGYRFD